jgi:hypothetical protein
MRVLRNGFQKKPAFGAQDTVDILCANYQKLHRSAQIKVETRVPIIVFRLCTCVVRAHFRMNCVGTLARSG